MWELIQTNKRNSILLMVLMAVVLLALGFAIGMAAVGPEGGLFGLGIAAVIWLVLALISLSSGDQILLAASGAKQITHDVHTAVVQRRGGDEDRGGACRRCPRSTSSNGPGSQCVRHRPQSPVGLHRRDRGPLGRLNRDELQGVIAHEMSHILHRDILYMTLAGIMLGSVVLLSQVFMRGVFYGSMGSRRRYSSNSRGGNQAQILLVVIAIVAAILAPIMAQLLYFALSRRREYLADAGGARLNRIPRDWPRLGEDASDP
jgi:heat shock protein HtpX